MIEQAPGPLAEAFPWVLDPLAEKPSFSDQAFLEIESDRMGHLMNAEDALLNPLFEALSAIKSACGDTPLAVMLIPDEAQVNDELWGRVRGMMSRPETCPRDHAQEMIRAWLREHGIPCLDLLPRLRDQEALSDGLRHLYHQNDTHLNARGNRVVGQALAAFLTAEFPFLR